MSTLPRDFFVIIERDEDGMYVGEAPQFRVCYSQGRTRCVDEQHPPALPEGQRLHL
jgi:hypothetical protein